MCTTVCYDSIIPSFRVLFCRQLDNCAVEDNEIWCKHADTKKCIFHSSNGTWLRRGQEFSFTPCQRSSTVEDIRSMLARLGVLLFYLLYIDCFRFMYIYFLFCFFGARYVQIRQFYSLLAPPPPPPDSAVNIIPHHCAPLDSTWH